MRNMVIYLIRHSEKYRNIGIKNYNETSQINDEKIVLSVEGEILAKKLSDAKELKKIDTIWTSNYVRAIATSKYIAYNNNIEINIDERLGERKLGNLNSLKKLGENKKYSYTKEQLLDSKLKNLDGESGEEVNKRMTDFINYILDKYEGKKIAIVSHGAAIKFLLTNWCKINDNIELEYDNKELKIDSPCLLELSFLNHKFSGLKQIRF